MCSCDVEFCLPPPLPYLTFFGFSHTHTHTVTNIGLGLSIFSPMTRFGNLTIFWVYLAFVIFFVVMVGVLLIVFSILTCQAEEESQHSTSVFLCFFLFSFIPSSTLFTVPVPFHSLSWFHSIHCSNSTLFTVPVPFHLLFQSTLVLSCFHSIYCPIPCLHA